MANLVKVGEAIKQDPDIAYLLEFRVDTTELDKALAKAERLLSTLEKAKLLAGDLADLEIAIDKEGVQ